MKLAQAWIEAGMVFRRTIQFAKADCLYFIRVYRRDHNTIDHPYKDDMDHYRSFYGAYVIIARFLFEH